MEFNKILVPVDIHESSSQLIKFSFELATKTEASIVFMNVYKPSASDIDMEENELLVQHENKLNLMVEEISVAYEKVNYDCDVSIGFAAEKISEFVSNDDFDLLVMGSHNKTTLFQATGISYTVLGESKIPTILVPEAYRMSNLDHIIFCVEFEFDEIDKLYELLFIADKINCKITCVHNRKELELDAAKMKIKTYLKLFERYIDDDMLSFEIIEGNQVRSIEQYAIENDADLIVLLKERKNWLSQYWTLPLEQKLTTAVQVPVMVLSRL